MMGFGPIDSGSNTRWKDFHQSFRRNENPLGTTKTTPLIFKKKNKLTHT